MRHARAVITTLVLLGFGVPLCGCIVVPARPGWCYYHPYRCR